MKKSILLILILCSTLILSGCEAFSDFVIVNNSDDLIEVAYEVKKPGWSLNEPIYTTLKEFNDKQEKWQIVPDDRQKFENGAVKIKLAPNEVLRIERVGTGWLDEIPEERLNIKSLRISGKNGSINLEGKQVVEAFEPKYRSWSLIPPSIPTYIFYYK